MSKLGFLVNLPHRKSFCPDVSFYRAPMGMGFVNGVPIFAVEIRHENEHSPGEEQKIRRKTADYFAACTQVVWDVDLLSDDVVRSYRADEPGNPTIYRHGQTAEAEPALPGWSMPVDDLFPE